MKNKRVKVFLFKVLCLYLLYNIKTIIMTVKEILINELNLTEKEFNTLANYAYCDHFVPGQMTTKQWQNLMKEAMMEDEMFEMESGESIFRPGDKGIIINILNR